MRDQGSKREFEQLPVDDSDAMLLSASSYQHQQPTHQHHRNHYHTDNDRSSSFEELGSSTSLDISLLRWWRNVRVLLKISAAFGFALLLATVLLCVSFQGSSTVRSQHLLRSAAAHDSTFSSTGSTETTIYNNNKHNKEKTSVVSSLVPPYRKVGGEQANANTILAMAYASDPLPFSMLTPTELGLQTHFRPSDSAPGDVFGMWRQSQTTRVQATSRSQSQEQQQDNGSSKSTTRQQEQRKLSMPTNMWYQNLLLGSVNDGIVTPNNRAYTIPYIVDFCGAIPGIRVHFPHMVAHDTVVQMSTVPRHGLTIGTISNNNDVPTAYIVDEESPPSQLGLGLVWFKQKCGGAVQGAKHGDGGDNQSCGTMKTSVLRGIPYATMEYSSGMRPVISAEVPIVDNILIDGDDENNNENSMRCGDLRAGGNDTNADVVRVEKEVQMTFAESDFTWLIFFSRPVEVSCFQKQKDENAEPLPPGVVDFSVKSVFELHVVGSEMETQPLIVRAALANNCTHGLNPLYCVGGQPRHQTHLGDLLRLHSDIYPSKPGVRYEFPASPLRGGETSSARIHFDWNPRSMKKDTSDAFESTNVGKDGSLVWWKPSKSSNPPEHHPKSQELLMYALPHHIDSLEQAVGSSNSATGYCSAGLHGKACLIRGGEWVMKEDLDGPPNFAAQRPPHHTAIPALAEALSKDIQFELPDYYMRGAGDTYFSGKMLAKLGRIIVVASELKGLAATPATDSFDLDDPSQRELQKIVKACQQAELPSEKDMADAIARLRSGVEVWLNGTADARFIYDHEWGGLVNCGCLFNSETQRCDNSYPDCPAFSDPGLNFGNGFFNDHHFHYGYHIYAAAVVASFDLTWGRKYFQDVLAFVRDIANPSNYDKYFPVFRHKDWYLGSSWASGIATLGGQPYLNGRNQESSSEAIHAYEAIGLYGAVMVHAWGNGVSSSVMENDNAVTASRVRDMGRLLTATELRSAKRYWHVLHGDSANNTVYPKVYKPSVVGMMWDTMCQFQTWFGNAPYLAYGIQLMPLTSVSERRDTVIWAQQMYPGFAGSCDSDKACEEQGWSILQHAMLAVVGHRELALQKATALPDSVFESPGGNGHSLTNTLWYIATRPDVAEPLVLDQPSTGEAGKRPVEPHQLHALDCKCPKTCSKSQLDFDAGGYSCESRIRWLIKSFGKSEVDACRQVAGNEFPVLCGGCDPDRCAPPPAPSPVSPEEEKVCPPCTPEICKGEANRCPRSLLAPFLCVSGRNMGGCAQTPWINQEFCTECCKLTEQCFGV